MNLDQVDLKNPDLYVSSVPHEIFTRLRREDPVHWNPESDGRGFHQI
jgi:linalool 8-monooxygenase